MSDARAIEAVTETLRSLVDIGVKQVESAAVAVARPSGPGGGRPVRHDG